jgi:glycerol-3-phosphate acyltransferase PlsY
VAVPGTVSAAGFAGMVVLGYLLGTFPSAVIVTRLATRGRMDIRATGSGNPGGFNTFLEVGKVWGIVVVLLDGGKAMVAGLLALWWVGDAAAYAAATAVIAGHIWPVWVRFRGGKGVAAAGGAVLGVFPAFFPVNVLVLGLGAVTFRDSRRAMLAGMSAWFVASILWTAFDWPNGWGPEPGAGLILFSTLGAAMVMTKFWLAARAG